MRKRLDDLVMAHGQKVHVYFPHGGRTREMIWTGEVRAGTPSLCSYRYDFEMRAVEGRNPQWIPGWYLAGSPPMITEMDSP